MESSTCMEGLTSVGIRIIHPKVKARFIFLVFILGYWNVGAFSSDFFSFLSKIRDEFISWEWESGGDFRGLETEKKMGHSQEEQWEEWIEHGKYIRKVVLGAAGS